jgi:hypothetical protein
MSLPSVQLKIAATTDQQSECKMNISPTLYDGFLDPATELESRADVRHLKSMKDVLPLLRSSDAIENETLLIDLHEFENEFSRFLVYLSPILYRWKGTEMVVVLPPTLKQNSVMASMSDLLRSLELRSRGIRLISCPTCARCKTNFPEMVRSIESRLGQVDKPLDVAVMGCEVNGPGEAKAADIGIAFGDQKGMMFKRGEQLGVVSIEDAADMLLREIDKL